MCVCVCAGGWYYGYPGYPCKFLTNFYICAVHCRVPMGTRSVYVCRVCGIMGTPGTPALSLPISIYMRYTAGCSWVPRMCVCVDLLRLCVCVRTRDVCRLGGWYYWYPGYPCDFLTHFYIYAVHCRVPMGTRYVCVCRVLTTVCVCVE